MKREVERVKRTMIAPNMIQDIDVFKADDKLNSERTTCLMAQGSKGDAGSDAFAGVIVIQDRLSAMRQALSEHTRDGDVARRTRPPLIPRQRNDITRE